MPPQLKDSNPDDAMVELLGTQKNGMALIHPNHEAREEQEVVDILKELDDLLQNEAWVRKEMFEFLKGYEGTDESVRCIQGGRVEIFLQAGDKKSTFFDDIVTPILQAQAENNDADADPKSKILNFARKKALQDPRLANSKDKNYQFGNFSILVSLEASAAQAPHIDLTPPNHQFGLIVTPGTEGTMFYETQNHIHTVEALAELWPEIPPALGEAFKKSDTVRSLLDNFGDTLYPEHEILPNMRQKVNLPTGTLLSLPGGVVHAGPASKGFRSVLFFSAWPQDKEVEPYDPDVQYMGCHLVARMVRAVWHRPELGFPERYYLLQRLAEYIENSSVWALWVHLEEGPLAQFMRNIEEKAYNNRDQYIQQAARDMAPSDNNDNDNDNGEEEQGKHQH